jgi:hypothetical protein
MHAGTFFDKDMTSPPFETHDHCFMVIGGSSPQRTFPQGLTNTNLTSEFTHFLGKKLTKFNTTASWSDDEWAYVCAQLKVPDNQTERVPIKFCFPPYGCNFSYCPHRDDDDQETLFRFSEASKKYMKKECFKDETPITVDPLESSSSMLKESKLAVFYFSFLLCFYK